MITPRFRLLQDDSTLSIVIRAPYCSLQELDVSVDQDSFIFTCKPYYLRLNLPGCVEENDDTKSCFNSELGEFTFQYEKVNPGEDFPDLEFITKFLCSKILVTEGERKIEIVADNEIVNCSGDEKVEYGFAMRGGYNFKALSSEFRDVLEVDPHETNFKDRLLLQKATEQKDFNKEHYLADLIDNEVINSITELRIPWKGDTIEFSESELDFLKDLPNITYTLTPQQVKFCHNSLLEILYAYCYDRRINDFEANCESGWTISKLSATLSWFVTFSTPKEALICAFRRSLIYPLYRSFQLSIQVFEDLKLLLKFGEKLIIKCLIDIYEIFLKSDRGCYVLNNLYVRDYIIYVMKWDKKLWLDIVDEVNKISLEKNDLALNLSLVEAMLFEEDLVNGLSNLIIIEDSDSDDSSSSSSSESESDSESWTELPTLRKP